MIKEEPIEIKQEPPDENYDFFQSDILVPKIEVIPKILTSF